jgi:hypothetical protein
MAGGDFGLFMLGYSGVLLVSQLFRVAVGEAGLLAAHDNESRWRCGPLFIGAALTITPVLGLGGFVVANLSSRNFAFALATGAAVCVVSSTEIGRYALLSRGLVRKSLRLDLTWTLVEFGLLAAFRSTVLESPSALLWCWTASALIAFAPVVMTIRPASPRASIRALWSNEHSWRLTANDALVSGTSFLLLAFLALLAGTAAVGAVRASMLPFQWVQLAIASSWLVVLSRQPSGRNLRRLTAGLFVLLVASIGIVALIIYLLPTDIGVNLLRDNWQATQGLVAYAAATFVSLTTAEIVIMRRKAARQTTRVLRARIAGSLATFGGATALLVQDTPEAAFIVTIVGSLATALFVTTGLRVHNSGASPPLTSRLG